MRVSLTTKQLSEIIMGLFIKRNAKPNHAIDEKWLNFNLLNTLNPKEVELVNNAIDDLVNQGLVTVENRYGTCIVLTEKGFNEIYPIDKTKTKEKIKYYILNLFAERNSKPNHVIDEKWLNFNYFNTLNPKELELFYPAVDELVNEGLVTIEDRYGKCIVLTQKGFNKIY